jgi:hypothetical protein
MRGVWTRILRQASRKGAKAQRRRVFDEAADVIPADCISIGF